MVARGDDRVPTARLAGVVTGGTQRVDDLAADHLEDGVD